MYKLAMFITALIMVTSCGNKKNSDDFSKSDETSKTPIDPTTYDPNRGIGKFTTVDLGDKLNESLASEGDKIQSVKCAACHKLTNEKLVGPGWKGVMSRHKPEWIMNFITNPDPMIDKDPKLQALLEICLVRMPNQSLSDTDARNLLEYMRKNDGIK